MKWCIFSLALLVSACDEVNYILPPTMSPTPTPVPAVITPLSNIVEYRVQGNSIGAIIRYSNPIDGLTSVTTGLPYAIQFATTQTTMFVSLEATPTGFPGTIFSPFISVQIFVNNILFREATSQEFVIRTISAGGTWRK